MRVARNANRILVRNPEKNRSHGRPRHRSENNIKRNLEKMVLKMKASMKMTVFWDDAPCSLVRFISVSEVLSA
jgi:hypothetical protein